MCVCCVWHTLSFTCMSKTILCLRSLSKKERRKLKNISSGLLKNKTPLNKDVAKNYLRLVLLKGFFRYPSSLVLTKDVPADVRVRLEEELDIDHLFSKVISELGELIDVIKDTRQYVVLGDCHFFGKEVPWFTYLIQKIIQTQKNIREIYSHKESSIEKLVRIHKEVFCLCNDKIKGVDNYTLLEEVGRQLREVAKTQKTS